LRVSVVVLEHHTPCLAFAIEEPVHVNVWKNRLAELELPVGPWLRKLKQAVLENKPDDEPIRIGFGPASSEMIERPLATLRSAIMVTPGQKLAYVTDAADTPANRSAIIRLARNADLLFIEAAFAQADTALATERAHLTTAAAGNLARAARVRRVEPFHFSPRYSGQEARMMDELMVAFIGAKAERG
jgi:ribonuclease Z